MRFLIAAAICAIAILACGTTAVNAQVEPEISVLKFLANSTGGWENVSSGAWLVNTTHHACGVNGTRWSGIKCDHIGGIDHVVEIRFPSGIRINGSIELIELNPLRYLRSLQIWNTELTGSLPDLSTHPTLQSLLIGGNPKFSGPFTTKNIPPHLRRIEIRDRRAIMTEPFPSFDAVNNITLNYIRLQNVQINGTLPSFERFINLKEVYIQENKISGSVPRFGPSLRILSLTKNELSGFDVSSIPVTVQILELNRNRIIAPFPDLSKLTDPYRIELSENGFYGDVPLLGKHTHTHTHTYIEKYSKH